MVVGTGCSVLSAMWTWHLSFSKEYHAQNTISGMCKSFWLPSDEWFLDPRKQPSCTIDKRQRKRPQTNHRSFIVKGFKSILRVWWWWKVLSKTWWYRSIYIQNLDTYFENARKEHQEEPGYISRMPEKSIRNLGGYLKIF
jgi:hypothetical protein